MWENLKSDWSIASIFEKIRFIIVVLLIFIFGCIGVWHAILFHISKNSHNNDDAIKYIAIVLASVIALIILKMIKLNPKGSKHKDGK